MSRVYADNSQAIGNTPLVRLNHVTKGCKATVLAKIEGRNPAYSVKCRIGANMIWDAEKRGVLSEDLENHCGAHLRQYRHCPGLHCRGSWLQADPHHAGIDVDRTSTGDGRAWSRADPHGSRQRHAWPPSLRPRKLLIAILPSTSCRVSLIIPPTQRSTKKPQVLRSGMTAMEPSMSLSLALAPVARVLPVSRATSRKKRARPSPRSPLSQATAL